MRSAIWMAGLALALIAAGAARAQTVNFRLLATANGNTSTVLNDSTLGFTTTIGTQTSISVQATYTGNSQATITQTPQQGLVGSTQFTVSSSVTAGTVLNRGDSFSFTITFSPASASGAAGQIDIPYTEPSTTGGAPVQSAILLGLQGTTPQFVVSYVLQGVNNQIRLNNGDTIPYGSVQLNTTLSANLDICNAGSGQGEITGITTPSAGSPFKLQGTPLFPFPLSGGNLVCTAANQLQLLVTYTPTAVESDTAQIQITFQGGATQTVNLSGSGILSTFNYSYVLNEKTQTVQPTQTITLPGANVGSTSSIIVQAKNIGSASATINSVSTSGPFTITNPLSLPATVTPGNSFSVPVTYTATKVGTETGQLVIGNDSFVLQAQGLGSQLTFAYTNSAGTTTIGPNGAVVFSPTAVGQSSQVQFTVTNTGLLGATISNIGTNPANGPYTIAGLPPLPLSLAAGQSANFNIVFKPTTTGYTSGAALILDTTSISLVGSGTAPPPLPSYTITGPSGNVSPATQATVSLTLSSPYSLDLSGTLTLTTQGTLGTDPSVQFAVGSTTGNRTVNFTIPANTTSANFAGQGTDLPVQTGTVAETVTLAPTFATSGGVDVTPSSLTTLQFTVPSEAPVLVSAQAAANGTNSFNLVLIGYSTTRSLTSMSVTFNPAPGYNIGTSTLSVALTPIATAWFQSASANAFGGQFMITMPFTLTGPTPKVGQTLLSSIASVTATVSNATGTSNSLQTPVP